MRPGSRPVANRPPDGCSSSGCGNSPELDRETVVRVAAAAERRLGGRDGQAARDLAGPAGRPPGGRRRRGSRARGSRRGRRHYDPRTIYRDDVETVPPVLDELILIAPGADASSLATAAERGTIVGEGANFARTLSNRASNDVSPAVLADEARAVAETTTSSIDVIEPERATKLGMGMFMAVGRGSDNPPRMIVLRSGGEGSATRSTATWRSSARACASTRAASASSRPPAWKR